MNPRFAKILACIRQAGPYLAIELILPGGSIIALTLWLLRNRPAVQRVMARIRSRAGSAGQFVAGLDPSTAPTL